MDNLKLDAEELRVIADEISGYCSNQREILNVYYAQMMALEDSWKDDKTFGSVIEEIRLLKSNAIAIIEAINNTYPKYFRKKADEIDNRPSFDNRTIHTTRIVEEVHVPRTSGEYYSRASSHIAPQVLATPSYPTTSYAGEGASGSGSRTRDTYSSDHKIDYVNTRLQSAFSNSPASIRANLQSNIGNLTIKPSKNGECYYDPCMIGKSGAIGCVGVVDFDASNCLEQLIEVVGHHTFYNLQKENQNQMINTVAREFAANKESQKIAEFRVKMEQRINKVYRPSEQDRDDLDSKEYKNATNLFAMCYKTYALKDEETLKILQEYFPDSLDLFKYIIKNDGALENIVEWK